MECEIISTSSKVRSLSTRCGLTANELLSIQDPNLVIQQVRHSLGNLSPQLATNKESWQDGVIWSSSTSMDLIIQNPHPTAQWGGWMHSSRDSTRSKKSWSWSSPASWEAHFMMIRQTTWMDTRSNVHCKASRKRRIRKSISIEIFIFFPHVDCEVPSESMIAIDFAKCRDLTHTVRFRSID